MSRTKMNGNKTETNGRDSKGHFVKGNNIAKNHKNPKASRRELFEKIYDEVVTPTELKAILLKQVEKAKKGDTKAAELVLERGYGKVKQETDINFPNDKPLRVIVFSGDGSTSK